MRLTKKIVAMSLVAALSASTLTACNGGEENKTPEPDTQETQAPDSDATEAPEGDENEGGDVSDSGNKKRLDDLGGIEIKVGDFYSSPEEDLSSKYAEDTYNYRQEIFEKYNFTVTREKTSSFADMAETFTTEVISGNPSMDIWYLYQDTVNEPLKNNLLYDLSKVKTVDFSEEKWNPQIKDLMSYNGGIYGMSTELEPRACIFFNKRLLEEAGIPRDEPYELQASGQWTWDKFEEYCKKLTRDIDGDGVTDIYAMASFSKDYYKLAAASNGAQFVSKDENGKYVNATKSQNFLDAANWATGLIEKGYIQPKPSEDASWDWFITAFRDGECAMQTAEAYTVSSFSGTMDDEFGIVMFPESPNGKMVTVPFDNVVVVPSCFDDEYVEKIMFGYDLYTECTPNWTLDESWKWKYYPLFTDERDVDETLVLMRQDEHRVVDYQSMISGTDYGDFTYAVQALQATPAEQLEKMTPEWDSYIKKANGE